MKKQRISKAHAGPKEGAVSAGQNSEKKGMPVVGIGASAGGLEAFKKLLEHLPVDTGMAFVLVQHLDPDHESALTEILARATKMPVREVTDKVELQANHVYVIPPDKQLTVKRGQLRLRSREPAAGAARSIDGFLESLAQEQQERAIGVILSGTASDGTLGLEAIKAEGGVTFAQDSSAKYDSMPRNAVAAGCVDFVLPPEGIARELARIAKHPHLARGGLTRAAQPRGGESPEGVVGVVPTGGAHDAAGRRIEDGGLRKILLLLRNQRGVDFSLYKPSTTQRRIARRMVLSKCETLEAYAGFVRGNEKEQQALYADLLISVTSFFRNPEAFETLKKEVFAKLLQHRRPDEPVRIWVAGCSTGQEVYSIAMAYQEFCENRSRAPELQIFGSDLNEALLEKARLGLYPRSLVEELSPERRRRFFVEVEGGCRISKGLRERCVFARHNLLSDPPFSRLDLISCRNLLIYLEAHSQQKILPAFHYALKPNGFLFLGASESLGSSAELFEPVDKKTRIYCRKPGVAPRLPLPVSRTRAEGAKSGAPEGKAIEGHAGEANALREADRVIANRFAPPGVLVDSNLRIVQSRGETGNYLGLGTGKASFDVLKMARGDLMLPLRAAINRARKHGKAVRAENLSLSHDAQGRRVNLEVIPLKNLKEHYYLICFEEGPGPEGRGRQASQGVVQPQGGARSVRAQPEAGAVGRRVAGLGRELRETRDYLQSVQEQYEAANEELQASNEEMTSANEELQSMNEELETSKEELESSNEELTTVSEEMVNRNRELSRLNSDLNNLQASINTSILVVGRDLRIQRFTPLAEKVFNLLATDVGRPLGQIRHNLAFPRLEAFITESIDTISAQEQEVRDSAGNWYVLRVRPYLTVENKIDGAVVVLVDVNVLKQTEAKIQEERHFAQAVIEAVPPLVILESDLRVRNANAAFYATFKVNAEQTEGRLIYEVGNGQWNIPALRTLFGEILPQKKVFNQYEVTHTFDDIGRRTMLISGGQIDHVQAIVMAVEDITVRKEAEAVLARSKEELEGLVAERTAKLQELVAELEHFSYSITHDMRAPLRSMIGFAEMMAEQCAECHEHDPNGFLKRIKTSAGRMDSLITDALNYSKAVRQELPSEPVDAGALLRGMLDSYPELQPAKVRIEIVGELPLVMGNQAGLTQCFSNLLGNAVKFVKPGEPPEIRICAEEVQGERSQDQSRPSGAGHSQSLIPGRWVRIWVEDKGIGISKEMLPRVFDMFSRGSNSHGGTGIGLALVRKVAQRMGGSAGVESEEGKGSRFWLELRTAEGGRVKVKTDGNKA
jgi:two-component system CheB/CheR fusion protein